MKKSSIAVVTLAAAIGLSPAVMFGSSQKDQPKKIEAKESKSDLQKEAKISMKQARSIALKKVSGKIKSSELEREDGKLLYTFDIKTGKGITEVHVDAITGEILKVEQETAAKEAAEKKLEANKKH
jgi:uncharacterized membrane protein YkoI